jgi:hypothetical protein
MTWLRPNALGLILFLPSFALAPYLPVTALVVWLAFERGPSAIGSTATRAMLLGFQLVLAYVVSMPLGGLLAMATRPRRRDVLLAVCATAAVAFLAAVIVSKQYWGYYFSRAAAARACRASAPGARRDARRNAKRRWAVEIRREAGPVARRSHPGGTGESVRQAHLRALVALADRQLLPETPTPVRVAMLTSALAWLEATGLLVSGETGYPNAKRLFGVLLEIEDDTGEALTFLGVGSGEVSNDHYACYEVVLSVPSGAGDPRTLSATRFFHDIAGIEGAE